MEYSEKINGTAPAIPANARELQLWRLDQTEGSNEFSIEVRAPANFAAVWLNIEENQITRQRRVVPFVAWDTLSTGELLTKRLALVPFGMMWTPKPDKVAKFLGAFLDPTGQRGPLPVALYEISDVQIVPDRPRAVPYTRHDV